MNHSLDGWEIGLLCFGSALSLHFLLWRYVRSARRYPVLFALFFVASLIAVAVSSSPAAFWVAACLSLNYLAIFPAFQASSPTLVMLNHLWKRSKLSEGALRALFQESVVSSRLEDLFAGDFIREVDGKLVLTGRGKALATLFRSYRRFLGLPEGDGG